MPVVAREPGLEIVRVEVSPFGTNAYILRSDEASLVVDAPGEARKILELAGGHKALKGILITHTHVDHIMGLEELNALSRGVPVFAHPYDARSLPSRPDRMLGDGQGILLGGNRIRVLHTPGHTPGSVCFLVGPHLISGDTIFRDGPGKTASPADFDIILDSLTRKIFALPDETDIFPGHGESAVLKEEKAKFQTFLSRPRKPGLCGDVIWTSS